MTNKWRDLEAQGVKRCCGIFTDGTRCRRRAVQEWGRSWCAKHGPIVKLHTDYANKAMQAAKDDEDD